MPFRCVYCGRAQEYEFNEEHVVSRGLGKFLLNGHELIIKDRICNECNNDMSLTEGELAYAGVEAMHRRKVGIKGRNRGKQKANPFYRNPFSKKPIRMVGTREGDGSPCLWELDPKTGMAIELDHVRFQHPETNQTVLIPVERKTSRRELLEEMKRQGWIDKHPFEIFCSSEKKQELFQGDEDKMEWQDRRELPPTGQVNVSAEMLITGKHHQAIAKIAFNYLMYFRPCGIKGDEGVFAGLRAFIRYGKGNPNHFVRYTGKPVLYEAGAGLGLVDYGHIVTCDVNETRVQSFVHLFTGREHGHGAFEVGLGKYPFRIVARERLGHWFRITSNPSDKEDSGEVIPVMAPTRIVPAFTLPTRKKSGTR